MASFHHQDNQTSIPVNSPTDIRHGTTSKVPSTFHSIESLMPSCSMPYPYHQLNDMSQSTYGPYNVLSPVSNDQSYPHINMPIQPSCDKLSGTAYGGQFLQPSVSDLSVNPFQDPSDVCYSKKPLCLQESSEFSPLDNPPSNENDEILDVDSYSPFGSPTESNDVYQTNPGPCSTSSTGYSSGYLSCEGSTENSPLRPFDHPLPDFHQGPVNNYNPESLYLSRQPPFIQSSATDLSTLMSTPAALSSDIPSNPPAVMSSPASIQSVDLTCPPTPTVQSPLPSVQVTSEPDAPVEETQVKKTRVKYTSAQLEILEKAFKETPYPDWDEMEELSKKLDIAEQKIKVWFQNKRARWRKKQTAQQILSISDFKPLPQMSALYRFPSSAPSFPQSNQTSAGSFPARAPLPFLGNHYPPQPVYRPSSVTNPAMSSQIQTHNFPANQSQRMPPPSGPSSACYQPPMMHTGTTGFSHVPPSNYGNFGHMSNNYMYPYM